VTGTGCYIRGAVLFVAGVVFGTVMMQSGAAQEFSGTGIRLNHVGIAVKDYDESLNFYTKVMGFRVAFGGKTPDGKPGTAYLQINRDTFLEIAPASQNAAGGTITHVGIQVQNMDATVARLRGLGATVADPRVSPGLSKSKLSSLNDPNGIRLELSEAIPGSALREAIESYK